MIPPSPLWLLCIHKIPPKPAYLRAKAARRLAALGAVPVKNAVYVLPDGEQQRDGLLWLTREIEQGGGRAYVCGASFSVMGGGLDDASIKSLFVDAREKDYRELLAEFQPLFAALRQTAAVGEQAHKDVLEWMSRLRTRFDAVTAIDFFGAPGRETVEGLLSGTGRWIRCAAREEAESALNPALYMGRVWVTGPGVHVDRIATAWFIRRYIDPDAIFRFDGSIQTADDIGFDMPEAAFTHEGEHCTFENMARRFAIPILPALQALCYIVHDIDLGEGKALRSESAGFAALLNGMCLRITDDHQRLAQGIELFDGLYEHFKRLYMRREDII